MISFVSAHAVKAMIPSVSDHAVKAMRPSVSAHAVKAMIPSVSAHAVKAMRPSVSAHAVKAHEDTQQRAQPHVHSRCAPHACVRTFRTHAIPEIHMCARTRPVHACADHPCVIAAEQAAAAAGPKAPRRRAACARPAAARRPRSSGLGPGSTGDLCDAARPTKRARRVARGESGEAKDRMGPAAAPSGCGKGSAQLHPC